MTDSKDAQALSNVAYAEQQLARYAAISEKNPDSRSARFFKEAFATYRDEAKRDQMLATAEDVGELIDFRFLGPRADNGSMPLGHFLAVMDPLNKGLNRAAYRLRNGKEAERIGNDIKDALNLKMAGVGYGSTRIFVTGDGRPDMTGQSLLNQTLTQTFRLLNADNETFYDCVDAVGGSAARYFGEALRMTNKHGMAAEFTWKREENSQIWSGRPADIDRIVALIDSTKEPEVYEEVITGVVATIADTGTIYLRIGEDKVKVRYPLRLIREAQRLSVMQSVRLRVSTSKYWDAVLHKDVFKHTLLATQS